MGLRETAAADLQTILEDSSAGFGREIVLTNPTGTSATLVGYTNDISHAIDVNTGLLVVGRTASVAISIQSLEDAGLALPKGVPDKAGKPWLVSFEDMQGASYLFKVSEAKPDRALGCVVCMLEAYKT